MLTELEEQAARSNLDVRLATVRLQESRLQRGVTAADEFPNAQRQRLLHAGEGQPARRASGCSAAAAAGGSTGNRPGPAAKRHAPAPAAASRRHNVPAVRVQRRAPISARSTCSRPGSTRHVGDRFLGPGAAPGGVGGRHHRGLGRDRGGTPGDRDRRGGARLPAAARPTARPADRAGHAGQRPAEPAPDAGAAAWRADHGAGRGQRRGAGGQHGRANPATGGSTAATTINAISLLLGRRRARSAAELSPAKPVPPVPPAVPVGLPSELARRRPDIRRAEAQLHAATADIGAAEADFFPKVTLSGSVGVQATAIQEPLGNLRRIRGAAILRRPFRHHPGVRGRPSEIHPGPAQGAAAGGGGAVPAGGAAGVPRRGQCADQLQRPSSSGCAATRPSRWGPEPAKALDACPAAIRPGARRPSWTC